MAVADDTLHVTYGYNSYVEYLWKPASGGNWQQATSPYPLSGATSIAAHTDGTLHLLSGDDYIAVTQSGMVWSDPIDVIRDATGGHQQIAVDSDGDPHVVATLGPNVDTCYIDLTQGSTSYYYANGQAVAERTTNLIQTESDVYYLHHDLMGNLTEVTDEGGEVVGRARYDAFGVVLSSTIPLSVTGRLPAGGQIDTSVGLVYAGGGRWYDPVLGVYLQPDPFGGAPVPKGCFAKAPESLNRYAAGVSTFPTLGSVPGCGDLCQALWTNSFKTTVDKTTDGLWIGGRLGGRMGAALAGYLQNLSTIQVTKYRKTYKRIVEHARLDSWIRVSYSGIDNLRARFGGFLPFGGLGQRGLKWAHKRNVSIFSELVPYSATAPNPAWYGRAAGRLGTLPWGKIGAEFAGGLAVDVIFQFGFDWVAHPDWTWQQRGLSMTAQVPGSLAGTAAGLAARGLATWAAAEFGMVTLGATAGPIGIAFGFLVAVGFDIFVTPKIYKALGFD